MKTCPNCSAQIDDQAAFCPDCGYSLNGSVAPTFDPYDHTAEFSEADISENKLFCMLVYLLDVAGVIIALLAAKDSPYTRFHVRQALKFTICEVILAFVTALLVWTVIVPILGSIAILVLLVVKIICFVRVCKNQAVEPPIICKLEFLR